MEQVFAPWRIEWVERDDSEPDIDGCPFCVLPGRDDAREALVVAESEHAFVLLNNYPYNPGHVMVIPHAHTGAYGDLDEATDQIKTLNFDLAKLQACKNELSGMLEAKEADIGITGGTPEHLMYRDGEKFRKIEKATLVDDLEREIRDRVARKKAEEESIIAKG